MTTGAPPAELLESTSLTERPGRAWSLAWTARVDSALSSLLAEFLATVPQGRSARHGGVALVALGSYARQSLCPQSDIDLLLLHDSWDRRELEALVQHVCYPLWDAGLSVGHAVRTTKEAIQATGERVDTATALTERRLVAGNRGMNDDLTGRVNRWLRRSAAGLAKGLVAADRERHRRFGGSAGALEPELKDGIGGLRDLHSLRWAGAILLGNVGLDPLVGARYLGAADRGELATAGETLLAVRCALHMEAGAGAHDRLRLDLQDDVARRMGIGDGDDLLREVGLATRSIAHLHARTWPVLLADATKGRRRRPPPPQVVGPALVLVDGLVELDPAAGADHDAEMAIRAAAVAATHETVIGRRSAVRLQRAVRAAGAVPWTNEARSALMTLLRSGQAGIPAMADLDYLGVIAAYLPEWDRVRGRPQRNPLHTYDLDTHALQASAWLGEIVRGAIDPAHVEVYAHLAEPDVVVLGTWLHDVGKAWPGDHSIAGETIARDWTRHMGFPAEMADRIGVLIRLHLLLPDVATQRDIDDPAEIRQVAEAVGDVEMLDALYLLSFADSRATGPAAWSAWKDLLITRLYHAVRAVLDGGPAQPQPSPDTVARQAAAHVGVETGEVHATVGGLPARYLRVASSQQVAIHTRMLHSVDQDLVVDVRPGPADKTEVLSIAAPDRRGMVADLLGVLAASRVDVLEARIFTHGAGTALGWVVVAAQPSGTWDRITPTLVDAYAGRVDVREAVDRRERARDVRPPALASPVPVSITLDRSGESVRVDARGPDSPGVLYRLTRVLSSQGVSLVAAQVATLGPEVRDTFIIGGSIPPDNIMVAALEPAFIDPDQ